MNKSDLVEALYRDKHAQFKSKAGAERCVEALIHAFRDGLKKDRSIAIVGMGTFYVRKRKPRNGRNPKTGETIAIPAFKTVTFRPSKSLKEAL